MRLFTFEMCATDMQRMHEFVTVDGIGRCRTNAYIADSVEDVGAVVFQRNVCLPSGYKMIN